MNWKKFVGGLLAVMLSIGLLGFTGTKAGATDHHNEEVSLMRSNEMFQTYNSIMKHGKITKQFSALEGADTAMANFSDYTYVYAEPNKDSEILGEVFANTLVKVLSKEGDWIRLSSGNLTGYAPANYFLYGKEGNVLMNAKCQKVAQILMDCYLYGSADLNTSAVRVASAGEEYIVSEQLSGWCLITDGSDSFYVENGYVNIIPQLQDGKTMAEIEEEQNELDALLAQMASGNLSAAQRASVVSSLTGRYAQYMSITMTAAERDLLNKVVYLEAGNNYEEAVKVCNVVFNRVLDSRYPNTVWEVLTQYNQFSTVERAMSDSAITSDACVSAIDSVMTTGENGAGTAIGFGATGDDVTNYYKGSADFEPELIEGE